LPSVPMDYSRNAWRDAARSPHGRAVRLPAAPDARMISILSIPHA
jgi:hypothetical protein